jgi:hypothetical protein
MVWQLDGLAGAQMVTLTNGLLSTPLAAAGPESTTMAWTFALLEELVGGLDEVLLDKVLLDKVLLDGASLPPPHPERNRAHAISKLTVSGLSTISLY